LRKDRLYLTITHVECAFAARIIIILLRKEKIMSEKPSLYGRHTEALGAARDRLLESLEALRTKTIAETGDDPIDHLLTRIKSEASAREKCRRKGIPETTESAMTRLHDLIGLRVVCPFLSDVFLIRDYIAASDQFTIVEEKDYIRHAKPNGYRSYHLIVRVDGYDAEIQLRTISMDTWAALEHKLQYKRAFSANTELIAGELKRCADELAATDISMQTIREMIGSMTPAENEENLS
jgi:putative GTP pyrophosphokinase